MSTHMISEQQAITAQKIYSSGLKEGWIGENDWSGLLIRGRVTTKKNPFEDQPSSESGSDLSQYAIFEEYQYGELHVEPSDREVEFKKLAPILKSSQYDCLLATATPLISLILQINESRGFSDQFQLSKKQIDHIPIFSNASVLLEEGNKGFTRFFLREEKVFVLLQSLKSIKISAQEIESNFLKYLGEKTELPLSNAILTPEELEKIRIEQQVLLLQERLFYEKSFIQGIEPPYSISSDFMPEQMDDVAIGEIQEKLQPPPPVITTDMETGEKVLQKGRTVNYLAPMSTGVSVGINIFMVMSFVTKIVKETLVDHNWKRLFMLFLVPFFMSISQFLWDNLVSFVAQVFFPIKHLHDNSLYYSGHASEPLPDDYPLPSFTIHMPCYKEGLHSVLAPSLESANEAVKAYRAIGGVANIIVSEDGMRLLDQEEAAERIKYYNSMDFGWVARPRHGDDYVRKGRFKKASNLNFTYTLSLRIEEIMDNLRLSLRKDWQGSCEAEEDAFEDELYQQAFKEAIEEKQGKAWAAGNIRVGDYILLIDSDTRMKADCLLEAAAEMERSPEVGALQHCSGVMYVMGHYFERFIGYFTANCINFSISWNCANGAMAPLMGHNVFLRWRAMQEVSKMEDDGELSVFSPHHVSEDFEMALKLQLKGYIVRWATYSDEGFTEGVSFTPEDEVTRYQKYAYGCSEIVFNPLKYWFTRGPFSSLFKSFLFSNVPLAYKFSTLSYLSTYYALAVSFPLGLLMFGIQGFFQPTLDPVFLPALDVWITVSLIFTLVGGPGLIIARARSGHDSLWHAVKSFGTHLPATICFFSGLAFHIMLALFAHLTGYNMVWTTTNKDFTETSIGQVFKRFKNVYLMCFVALSGIIIACSPALPLKWRVDPQTQQCMSALLPPLVMLFFHTAFPLLLDPGMLHQFLPDVGETTSKIKQKTTSFFYAAGDRIKEKYDTSRQAMTSNSKHYGLQGMTHLPSTSEFDHFSRASVSEKV